MLGFGKLVGVAVAPGVGLMNIILFAPPPLALGSFLYVIKSVAPVTGATVT